MGDTPSKTERERRLAEALRTNLRRRKAARAPGRTPSPGEDGPERRER